VSAERTPLDPVRLARALDLLRQSGGRSIARVARQCGLRYHALYKHLARHGLRMPPRYHARWTRRRTVYLVQSGATLSYHCEVCGGRAQQPIHDACLSRTAEVA
jgi:hypothetical protein